VQGQFSTLYWQHYPDLVLSPNAQALLTAGIFPAPTSGNRFNGPSTTPTNLKEEVVRIDHNFTSKFSVFGHFIAEQVTQGYSISQWNGANIPTVVIPSAIRLQRGCSRNLFDQS